MTWNVGNRIGSLRRALSSAGSYQAPRYHIRTILRARYFASISYGVLLLSSSSNFNASMIAWSRLGASRCFLTSRSRFSSAAGHLSLTLVKYSRFTSAGSEPGIDLDKSVGGGGTVGGFDDWSLNCGESFSGGIPVSALESKTKRTMCSWEFTSTLSACAGVSSVAPTVAAAVAAAAPVSTVRRVTAPAGSSSIVFGAIGSLCGSEPLMIGSSLTPVPAPRWLGATARLFQHEGEVRLVEEVFSCHVRRAHLLAHRVAVTGHAARRRERIGALAVGFQRGVREECRRRRAIHVRLFLKVGSRFRDWRGAGVFLSGAIKIARPLRAQQHVILPHRVDENVLKLLVHLLCFIGERDHARDVTPELAVVEFQAVLICWLPWGRRCLIHRTRNAVWIVKIVRSFRLRLLPIHFLLLGHILFVLERGPDPLPTDDRLVPNVESEEPKRLAQTGRLGRLVRMTRHQHQSVDRVEILPLGRRVEDLPGHLDHDRTGIVGRPIRLRRLALILSRS